MKSKGCLLTPWPLMATILFINSWICNSQLKCNYLKNEKIILHFLFHITNLHQILNIWKEKMMVVANVFLKLQTVKNFVRRLFKKWRFGTRLNSRDMKVFRIPAKSPWDSLYHVFFINLIEVDSENMSPRVRWNLRGVC